jgi:hypothetical protein
MRHDGDEPEAAILERAWRELRAAAALGEASC